MKSAQIEQVLTVRMLRAEKAERVFNQARVAESQAFGALRAAEGQLSAFDASYDARIAAYFENTATGVTPESLHSARSFHADLKGERNGILDVIGQAEQVVELARDHVARTRSVWAAASRAADSLGEIHARAVRDMALERERHAEMDADEIAVSRAYRDAG